MLPTLVILLVVGLIVVAYLTWAPRGDLVIKVRPGYVNIRGRLPQAKEGEFRDFFEQFADGRNFTIVFFYPRGDVRPPVRFRGPLTDGEKQQIRNFLLSEL